MASGPVSRTDRPNTWLLRPALRRAQSLDSPEPSTHGPNQTCAPLFGDKPAGCQTGRPALTLVCTAVIVAQGPIPGRSLSDPC